MENEIIKFCKEYGIRKISLDFYMYLLIKKILEKDQYMKWNCKYVLFYMLEKDDINYKYVFSDDRDYLLEFVWELSRNKKQGVMFKIFES